MLVSEHIAVVVMVFTMSASIVMVLMVQSALAFPARTNHKHRRLAHHRICDGTNGPQCCRCLPMHKSVSRLLTLGKKGCFTAVVPSVRLAVMPRQKETALLPWLCRISIKPSAMHKLGLFSGTAAVRTARSSTRVGR